MVEKVTRNYIAICIPGRTTDGVEVAISQLEKQYGSKHFSTVFRTMPADNGLEFTTFSKLESLWEPRCILHIHTAPGNALRMNATMAY